MNDREFKKALSNAVPDVPPNFHWAMMNTLNHLEDRKPLWRGRRALALALALALMLGTAAYAAYHWNLFDAISFYTGANPVNADQIMQASLHKETVNGVEIEVREAGYDGRTLLIQYSYRLPDVEGEMDWQQLTDRNVGWWTDHLWIDGKCLDMAANSGSTTEYTANEIIQTEYWRLDNIDVSLLGSVNISLPIGDGPDSSTYAPRKDHPEKYDAEGNMLMPEQGLVTFTLDTGNTLSKVVTEHPGHVLTTDLVTASVSEAAYTPLMTYITLDLEVNPDAMAAFLAENGEGYKDEDGNVLFPYGGMDVFDSWLHSLQLVDGEGNLLFPDRHGNNGYGNRWAEFLYPHIETLPDELYLAPVTEGTADLTQAVKVR